MGKKSRQEKQLKAVKKRLEQERKSPKGRKPYAIVLAVSGVISLFLAGSNLFINKQSDMLTSMCLLLGVGSLFLAYSIYDDEAKRIRKIEELEKERDALANSEE